MSTETSPHDQKLETPRPQWGIIAAGVFLIMILIGAVFIWVNRDSTDDVASSDSASAVLTDDDRQSVTDRLGRVVFIPDNADGDILGSDQSAPAGVQWQRLAEQTTISVARDYPFSASDGPATISNGVAQEFSRTELGAALAGIHAFLGIGEGGDKGLATSLHFMTDTDAHEALEYIEDHPDGPQLPELAWTSTFAAYTPVHFSEDSALIRYAVPAGESYHQFDVALVWIDGDWGLSGQNPIGTSSTVSVSEVQSWTQL